MENFDRTDRNQWEKDFIKALEDVDKMKKCFDILREGMRCGFITFSSCSLDDAGKNGGDDETLRGNFILKTLNNSNEARVRSFLSSKDPDERTDWKKQRYYTPSFLQNVKAVRCMIKSECKFEKDEDERFFNGRNHMKRELRLLNRNMARADPVYISARFLEQPDCKTDPVITSFNLEREFKEIVKTEYEFTREYQVLRERCVNFGVALLDECHDEEEVRCVLETQKQLCTGNKAEKQDPLDILHLAILNNNKKFASHPYSQMLLNSEIYEGVSWLERKSYWLIFGVSLLMAAFFPLVMAVFTLFHVMLPTHDFSKMISSPLMKYLTSFGSYIIFLVLLIFSAFQPSKNFLVFSIVDWLILIWVIGLLVDIAMDVFFQIRRLRGMIPPRGLSSLFCSGWNVVGVIMVLMFILYHAVWLAGFLGLTKEEKELLHMGEIDKVEAYSTVLVSFSFVSFGFLFAFVYMLSFSSINPYIGPLQYALVEMVKDVLKFFIFFAILFFAFSFSFKKLYLQYTQGKDKFRNSTTVIYSRGGSQHTFKGSLYVTFWALFGSTDLSDFDTDPAYDVINYTGLTLFAVFNVIAVLVALNILIAMLNTSYSNITVDLDIAWKFTRAQTWMKWIYKEEAIPPPFNTLSLLLKFLAWMFSQIRKCKSCSSDPEIRKCNPCSSDPENQKANPHSSDPENRKCNPRSSDPETCLTEKADKPKRTKVLEELVKRYLEIAVNYNANSETGNTKENGGNGSNPRNETKQETEPKAATGTEWKTGHKPEIGIKLETRPIKKSKQKVDETKV